MAVAARYLAGEQPQETETDRQTRQTGRETAREPSVDGTTIFLCRMARRESHAIFKFHLAGDEKETVGKN